MNVYTNATKSSTPAKCTIRSEVVLWCRSFYVGPGLVFGHPPDIAETQYASTLVHAKPHYILPFLFFQYRDLFDDPNAPCSAPVAGRFVAVR